MLDIRQETDILSETRPFLAIYMGFGKCMGTLGGHMGSFILRLESVWGP